MYLVFFQVHSKLNNTHLALMHFSWAMDLDPKVLVILHSQPQSPTFLPDAYPRVLTPKSRTPSTLH